MKITNSSIETLAPGSAAAACGVGAHPSRTAANKNGNADSVNLSSASQLVNLAKATNAAPERTTKLANLAALVRSGQYSADTASVSHAVVEGHIQ